MNQLAIDFVSVVREMASPENRRALFDNCKSAQVMSRTHDPETSHAAAERAQSFAGHHEAAIYAAISESPHGVNYKEIATVTGLEPVAVARRLSAMESRKLIERRPKPGSVKAKDYQEREGCALWWRT